jgi:nicotinate-nucleotide adenylyltransferase
VLLMPAHTPPHKLAGEDPGAEHRLRMCQLAAAAEEGITACGLELERGGPSYTVDTLETVHTLHPHARLTFIVGADTARTFGSWREPRRLLELAELAVATRTGSGRREVLDALAPLAPAHAGAEVADARVHFLAMPAIEVSSSSARERVARGQPIDELVGPAVAAYIAEQGLYAAPIGAVS